MGVFLWSLKSGRDDDLDGAAARYCSAMIVEPHETDRHRA
jgi:cbb3-type cytochrome oxidase maturation protein